MYDCLCKTHTLTYVNIVSLYLQISQNAHLPDPYIGTNEIGLPLAFAKTLTFPTPVTSLNIGKMQSLVRRGPDEYPGAVWVEFPTGRINLSKMPANRRNAIASRLLSSGSGVGVVTVGRQLVDGDMVLMNRQVSSYL